MICLINYGMGNLQSVVNAFEAVGRTVEVTDKPIKLANATAIVLPGVGAFGDGMAGLRDRGFVEALNREVRERGKPFLGFCLGLQLLTEVGTEHGTHQGLGWIPGQCERLSVVESSEDVRIPHIGWNDVHFVKTDGLYAGLGDSAVFYFVHSYAVSPPDKSIVSGVCNHGGDFVASVEFGNISATQFHPEKSQSAGLKVLENWCAMAQC
jgi:glutamine amidotransferase